MWRFGARCLETLRQSRERQAMRVIAGYARLLEQGNDSAAPCRLPPGRRASVDDRSTCAVPKRPGLLLGAIAVVLIALHAICAAMILDHALLRAPELIAISGGDRMGWSD
ncbi:hypothetical protein AYJ54_41405 [Bradyrhizobium centrolobii]|uniref:Uncharacterized protein n=2 Tax=Bradyrhizobium centrolobii TaxID=1505087 RepID=A0A176Z279_9BRAD|nr:hypothetical protein AYJ54_41405 [Bradyrhizobium centrolobii]